MATDESTKVTRIHGSKSPTGEMSELAFREGEPCTFRVFMGLKGVCRALENVEGRDIDATDYLLLSTAAGVLVDILEGRQD